MFRRKKETKTEETRHERCHQCGKTGHAVDMVSIPYGMSVAFDCDKNITEADEEGYREFCCAGNIIPNIEHRIGYLLVSATLMSDEQAKLRSWFCREHVPLQRRGAYGGWEYTKHGDQIINRLRKEAEDRRRCIEGNCSTAKKTTTTKGRKK